MSWIRNWSDAFRTWTVEGLSALEAAQYGWIVLQRPRGRKLVRAVLRAARAEGAKGSAARRSLDRRSMGANAGSVRGKNSRAASPAAGRSPDNAAGYSLTAGFEAGTARDLSPAFPARSR